MTEESNETRGWSMDDVAMLYDGGRYVGIYDGWIVARLKDGRIVNRWSPDDYRYERTEKFITELIRAEYDALQESKGEETE